ncbi:MAG: Gfo/Idh/MocA family oxidoreductase [Casimicrobiaceae bacterium]
MMTVPARLRVGIVGAGMISQYHLVGWRQNPHADLVAICDPELSRANHRAAEHGVPQTFSSLEDMLDACTIDAVDILTPVATHAPLVRIAADRGVHVMCQKPMAATLQEAQALVDYVGERVRFMVHENYRYRPHYRAVRQWVDEGRIGEVRMARMGMRCSGLCATPGEVPWLLQRQPYLADMPRLVVFETLIHHLDVMRAVLGELQVSSASLTRINPSLSGEDTAAIVLRGNNGLVATLDGTLAAPGYPPLPRDHLELIGELGTLVLDFDRLYLVGQEGDSLHFDLAARYQECFTYAVAQFVEGIRMGTAFESDRVDNLKTLQLVESCYQLALRPVGLATGP